jgi:urease accessory protein
MIPALLLLLLDTRAPAGGHSHSGGMEPAITDGLVRDLADVRRFCLGRLRTSGRVSAGAAAHACRLAATPDGVPVTGLSGAAWEWLALDDEVSARIASLAARTASRQLGSGMRRLLRSSLPAVDLDHPWRLIARPAPHHPLVLGAACALAGGTPELAARAAALAIVTASATAATRLIGLDPYAVQGLLSELAGDVEEVGAEAAAADDIPADCAPGLDLLADVHSLAEVRLFAS